MGRPWVRARFPEPLPVEAQEVAALWPYLELEGYRVDLEDLRFPWARSFEALAQLGFVPLPTRLGDRGRPTW